MSVSGVYGGEVDPMPMMEMFDRGHHHADGPVPRQPMDRRHPAARARQTTTRSACETWRPTVCRSPRRRGAYEMFQKKEDGCIKVVLKP